MKTSAAKLIATAFGLGYAPAAPGTAGSLGAVAAAWLLVAYAGWRPLWFGALALAALAPSIWAAGVAARESGEKDPGFVVIDEVVGQWVAIAGARALNLRSWLGAFVLFRLFDIWKPAPVRQLEALPGGTGIVADDVMAGAYVALVLFAAGCFNLY